MSRLLLRIASLPIGVAVAAAALALLAQFWDGPLGPIRGGPLTGEVARGDAPHWERHAHRKRLELELSPKSPSSRTTGFLVLDGALYVPAGFARHKRWPREVAADGRVVLRLGGLLYERQAVRVEDPALLEELGAALERKYGRALSRNGDTWFFRMDPRPAP